MLQYITNSSAPMPIVDQVFAAIEGGCRWVQIRMKDASDDEIRKVVETIKPDCEKKEVFLLLHSRVDLAKELNVGGVCLEKGDMPSSKARMTLGAAAVIGVDASDISDVIAVSNLDIDFFALGPFASRDKSKTGAPYLGIEGMRDICYQMAEKQIEIARVAYGGIKLDDVLPLIEAGANGIAVSSAIAFAKDPVKETERFIAALPHPPKD